MYSSSIESPLVPPSDGRHRSDTGTVGMSDRGIDRGAGLALNPGPRIPYSEKYQNSPARHARQEGGRVFPGKSVTKNLIFSFR